MQPRSAVPTPKRFLRLYGASRRLVEPADKLAIGEIVQLVGNDRALAGEEQARRAHRRGADGPHQVAAGGQDLGRDQAKISLETASSPNTIRPSEKNFEYAKIVVDYAN